MAVIIRGMRIANVPRERRSIYGETDDVINAKIHKVLEAGRRMCLDGVVRSYVDAEGELRLLTTPLTPAVFAMGETRFKKQFRRLTPDEEERSLEIADYVERAVEDRGDLVPFVYATDEDRHLIKVACEAALGKRDGIEVFGTPDRIDELISHRVVAPPMTTLSSRYSVTASGCGLSGLIGGKQPGAAR